MPRPPVADQGLAGACKWSTAFDVGFQRPCDKHRGFASWYEFGDFAAYPSLHVVVDDFTGGQLGPRLRLDEAVDTADSARLCQVQVLCIQKIHHNALSAGEYCG